MSSGAIRLTKGKGWLSVGTGNSGLGEDTIHILCRSRMKYRIHMWGLIYYGGGSLNKLKNSEEQDRRNC